MNSIDTRATVSHSAEARGYSTGHARKKRIIEVATQMFARDGYRSATIVQIAAECEISRAGLLHHFLTKEALLTAVLEERDRVDNENFWLHDSNDADGRAWLRRIVALAEHNASLPGIVQLFAVLSAESIGEGHPAHNYFAQHYRATRREATAAFERARSAGILLANRDSNLLGLQLVSMMDGLQVQWLFRPDEVDMAKSLHNWLSQQFTVPF